MTRWKTMTESATAEQQASLYADSLFPGDSIVMDTDWPVIAPFFDELAQELLRRGLRLEYCGAGWIVRHGTAIADGPVAVECNTCGKSWFDTECGHGIGQAVAVRW